MSGVSSATEFLLARCDQNEVSAKRELDEIAGDRMLLNLARQHGGDDPEIAKALEVVIRLRAERHASHPDYRQEWKS